MKIKLDENGIVIERKSRTRHKPTSGTVTPDKRMRTDTLLQIQRDHYVSAAGVDYDKEAIDELVRLRMNKQAERRGAKELREFEELERLQESGQLADEPNENHREIEHKEIEDLLF
jgi:hypothetical protein